VSDGKPCSSISFGTSAPFSSDDGEVDLREARQRVHPRRVPALRDRRFHLLDALRIGELLDDRRRRLDRALLEVVGQEERRFREAEFELDVEARFELLLVPLIARVIDLIVEQSAILRMHAPSLLHSEVGRVHVRDQPASAGAAEDERPARRRAAGDLERDHRQVAAGLDFHVLRDEARLLSVRALEVAVEDSVDLGAALRALRLRDGKERCRILGERGADAPGVEIVQRGHEAHHRRADVGFVVRVSGRRATGQEQQCEQDAFQRAATSAPR